MLEKVEVFLALATAEMGTCLILPVSAYLQVMLCIFTSSVL